MKIEEVKKQYKEEWILLKIIKEDDFGQPLEGNVLAHSPNRDDIYDALLKVKKGSRIATLFTGELLKEGYAAAFFVWRL